jgi:hypothetical protein
MLGVGVAGLGLAVAPDAAQAQGRAQLQPALVTHTFVKALPDRRAQLRRYLEQNWLAMDRRGIDLGIFTHALLFELSAVSDGASPDLADFVMVVGYLTPGGYADVDAKFRDIRRQHKTILVDGLDFKDLGRVTGEQQLRPVASA